MCAKISAYFTGGENPLYAKVNHQHRTDHCAAGGDKCREASGRDRIGLAQVKVLSPEMNIIVEVDVLPITEDSMKGDVMVSHHSLYRGPSPWHVLKWKVCELGRSSVFLNDEVC